ncbi:MAG: ASKHA domain-containing protein [Bacillota bacterium]
MIIKINSCSLVETAGDETLMSILIRNQAPVQNICNGKGLCGKCRVRILKGIPAPTQADIDHLNKLEIARGFRLACMVKPQEDMEIEIDTTEPYDRKEAALLNIQNEDLNPGVRKVFMQIPKPSLEDERGDWDRLADELSKVCDVRPEPNLKVLAKLPGVLRARDFWVTSTLWGNQVIEVEPGDRSQFTYGIAVDIGTTSVAAALVDLLQARVLKIESAENGQTVYGADVISRIAYAVESHDNHRQLRIAVRETVNQLVENIISGTGIACEDIYKMTVAANTTMSHLFLGLDVSHLAKAPYVSSCNCSLELSADELGLRINPQARVLIFPNIGSFVGGDTMGAVIGSKLYLKEGNILLIDLGTNCELFLKTPTNMMACSTAAGPAFEGSGITHGMRAKPGAIEGIKITENDVKVKVIGDRKAVGICGSGIIEGIEQMRKAGIISKQGSIMEPAQNNSLSAELKSRIRPGGKNRREFILSYGGHTETDIVINQKDIGELQLAKGAVCAGIKTITGTAGISFQDIDEVILAGTFASYLKAESILEIGLVPVIEPGKIRTVGNAAHAGAIRALFNQELFYKAGQLAARVRHIELGGNKIFTDNYMKSMYIDPS